MKKLSLLIVILCLFSCADSSVVLYDLTCENLVNPCGIATAQPRLSWKIKAQNNGVKQKGYRILVASRPQLLNEGKADLWNSGIVESSESVLITYSGKKLSSGDEAFWKVKIITDDDKETGWSDAASFSVGLLDEADWEGAYIGFPTEEGDPQCPLLRKQFELSAKPLQAFLHINSLGYHEVYLNGRKVGNEVLAPAVSQFNNRSLSKTYDISPYLNKGNNEIVVWLGRGWYQQGLPGVVADGPFVKAQIETIGKDGAKTVLAQTDGTWKASESGYTLTDDATWRAHKFGGERVDANVIPQNLSTDENAKRQWFPVTVVSIPAHRVTPQTSEGNRVIATYKAQNVKQLSDSVYLVDFGKCLTGHIEIKFPKLTQNKEITLIYSDNLNKDGSLADRYQKDYYVASGKKGESFRNKFNYHSFRYLEIAGIENAPSLDDMNAMLIRTDYRDASSFECSDADMNAIHDMLKNTLQCLTLGGYMVDCNHIERLGYGGDGHASTVTAQTMFDLAPLYTNWLQAWEDCIREDGGLPHTAPNPYPAGGGPYWCAFIVTAPWNIYLNYGDKSVLEHCYPAMLHWMQYVDTHIIDGLLKNWGDTDYRNWYLGDWATPTGINQTLPETVDLVDNCVISECYTMLETITRLLGKDADADGFAQRKARLNELIHNTFFKTDSSLYATGTQIDMIYPMLVGATPENIAKQVVDQLFNETANRFNGHLATGLVGIPVVTEWAVKTGNADFMYNMLKKRDYPGYLYMLDNGATATWEHWNGERSRIHNCYNGIGSWFYQALGGIRPVEESPGYRKILIQPQIPTGISWAKTSKETPYGTVSSSWRLNGDVFEMEVCVPIGSTAVVPISATAKNLTINGLPSESNNIELSSGKHLISYAK
ncbi:MAG: glycoside hydrolase family 78 protein [Dysgonamonadaceae bacterium]|jgi:alpha-L-rhamnosidase|nr:glycoside hydrolase family 78 protein [Dysgonamonadaceae bacterium]